MKNLMFIILLVLSASSLKAQTWTQIPVPSTKKLLSIDFPGNQVGYIGGEDSTLLKTTDGGITWQVINPVGISFFPGGGHIQKVKFVNDTTGFITVGPYGGAYKTTDGGNNWTALTLSNGLCFTEGLFFFDENNGFVGGSGCFQGEMIDQFSGGNTMSAQLNAPGFDNTSLICDIDFYNSNLGLASARNGRIYRTIDGGANWDSISVYGFTLNSVAFVNDTLCYAGYSQPGGGFGILKSGNAGLTWAEDFSSATFFYPNYYGLHVDANQKLYAGAFSMGSLTGLIFEKELGGGWNYQTVDQAIYALSSTNDSIVFAVGDSGYVIVNHPIPTGVKEAISGKSFYKAYPNPFQDYIVIESTSPEEGVVNIKVHNLQGQLVMQVNHSLQFPFSLSTNSLPAGSYELTLLRKDNSMERFKLIKR